MHTTLWLIRHGETGWNAERRFQGHHDVPLNELGRLQARQLARRLGAEHRAAPFEALVSSDLGRAVETARAAAEVTGLSLSLRADLRERHFGVLSALTPEEMVVQQPEVWAQYRARLPSYVLPGGESLEQFTHRVVTGLLSLARAYPGQKVAVVVHGGVLDCVYRAAMGLPLDAPRTQSILNASINVVRVDAAGTFVIDDWGDVAHLQDPRDDAETPRE